MELSQKQPKHFTFISDSINVLHKNGKKSVLNIDLIKNKINSFINAEPILKLTGDLLMQKIVKELYDGIRTLDINILMSKISADLIEVHTDYGELSIRIIKNIITKRKELNKSDNIFIIDSKGNKNNLCIERIFTKIENLINIEPVLNISSHTVITKTVNELANNISSEDIDFISSRISANMSIDNLDYSILGARIMISRIHKKIKKNYKDHVDRINKNLDNYFSDAFTLFVNNYHKEIDDMINFSKDYSFKYLGIMILLKSYLIKDGLNYYESPQQLYARMSIQLHLNDLNEDGFLTNYTFEDVKNTYNLLSDHYYTHATPSLFNAGNNVGSLSSCFLLDMDDSVDGIYETVKECAKISKSAGGLGVNINRLRAKNSVIKSSRGKSEGVIPALKVYDIMLQHMSQGGGKRKGSSAMYFELWHLEVMDILESILPTNNLDESMCPRDLFYAAWVNDLFFKRLEYAIKNPTETVLWSLFCPNDTDGLADVFGDSFESKYKHLEELKLYKKQINILELWAKIMKVLEEAGKLYILSKDNSNKKCNQNNLGIIKSSNLCVHGDTVILTDFGYVKIKNLKDQRVNVWNGEKFSNVKVFQTGTDQKLLKVKTSDGCILKCTEYHKFHLSDGSVKPANKLTKSDVLLSCTKMPIIDFSNDNELKSQNYISSENEKDVKNNPYFKGYNVQNDVPVNGSLKHKLLWLSGLIDYSTELTDAFTSIESKSFKFLQNVKLMCNTIGLNPRIETNENTNETIKNPKNNTYNLLFDFMDLYVLADLFYGFDIRLQKYLTVPNEYKNDKKPIKIESVNPVIGLHDTYCFNEPYNHTGIFNGLLTGNCSEILIYTDFDNIGVCNLSSICLPKFVIDEDVYDYKKLESIAYQCCINLNKVIDNNKYPLEKAEKTDKRSRPIGIGVQGLADVFMMMRCSYTSSRAKTMNKHIFESIYHGAMRASIDLAKKYKPYETYDKNGGSMLSNGILQFDLWGVKPNLYNWDVLRADLKQYGAYNSLLIALMPTASTSAIMDNSENFEPITSNIYNRSLLSGDFLIVNKYLVNHLKELNLWSEDMKDLIILNKGSVQFISSIPKDVREIYKTAYEYKLKDLVDMDADRCAFVCQSMSSNRFIDNFNTSKLTSMYLYAWKKGLKTLSYYIRTQPLVQPIQFTLDPSLKKNTYKQPEECLMCTA